MEAERVQKSVRQSGGVVKRASEISKHSEGMIKINQCQATKELCDV